MIWKNATNLTICERFILPTAADMTTMIEMHDSNVVLNKRGLASILLFVQNEKKVAYGVPFVVIVLDPNPVIMTLNQNFCIKGDSWILIANIMIAVVDPSQFPKRQTLSNMPKPTATKINIRITLTTSVRKIVNPLASFLKEPDNPQPIMQPTSVSIRLKPKNLFLLSVGSVKVLQFISTSLYILLNIFNFSFKT